MFSFFLTADSFLFFGVYLFHARDFWSVNNNINDEQIPSWVEDIPKLPRMGKRQAAFELRVGGGDPSLYGSTLVLTTFVGLSLHVMVTINYIFHIDVH